MATMIVNLQNEAKRIDRAIHELQKQKSAVDVLLAVYVKTNEEQVDPSQRQQGERGKGKAPRRPTGRLITELFLKAEKGASYSPNQILIGIGYNPKSAHDKHTVASSISNLKARGVLRINSLGLWQLA